MQPRTHMYTLTHTCVYLLTCTHPLTHITMSCTIDDRRTVFYYLCIYTHVHPNSHTYTPTHTCIHPLTRVHTYSHIYTCTHMYTPTHTCTPPLTHIHNCNHSLMYTPIHTCMCTPTLHVSMVSDILDNSRVYMQI